MLVYNLSKVVELKENPRKDFLGSLLDEEGSVQMKKATGFLLDCPCARDGWTKCLLGLLSKC